MSFKGILQKKCPNCGKGDLFKYSLSKVWKFTQMYDHCPECGYNYNPEPGFYNGAMYISYAMNTAMIVTIFLTANLLIDEKNPVLFVALTVIPVLVFFPAVFQWSRTIMLHLFRPK
ncbi:MAG: DUF983 domain-containing protein [Flammeovirgaceae bacterium]